MNPQNVSATFRTICCPCLSPTSPISEGGSADQIFEKTHAWVSPFLFPPIASPGKHLVRFCFYSSKEGSWRAWEVGPLSPSALAELAPQDSSEWPSGQTLGLLNTRPLWANGKKSFSAGALLAPGVPSFPHLLCLVPPTSEEGHDLNWPVKRQVHRRCPFPSMAEYVQACVWMLRCAQEIIFCWFSLFYFIFVCAKSYIPYRIVLCLNSFSS